ncbi:DNA-binding transcriptional ArsR family regulator [Rhizobium sp. BK077]|uniref:ArsR/SmtB family transcription factor n=1 Tax=unclassified Rhizobium TaxID=2613769 RepID=UPI00161E6F65|nr:MULTISPECIES: helix-turn-helix domain-containing protein [unclassified Rhizobium]MBB3297960.1 DNA-binding transcriptional ArsR family regulator [Rhizobium sp. BK112]MBB3366735.1 DNA-binding transcriptional ArsR family regulator [Rhizobium sp. BK077]MBB4177545.1 DNA-binding transcriptional ArsR family regulator [Rhizobium sp. BK109]
MRPLFHPALEDIRPEAILYALSDPERAAIFAQLAGAACGRTCSAFAEFGERVIPKSSLSNHFKVLRESGLILSERQGVEMRNQTRCAELDERFPGLIKAILTAYGQIPGQLKGLTPPQ